MATTWQERAFTSEKERKQFTSVRIAACQHFKDALRQMAVTTMYAYSEPFTAEQIYKLIIPDDNYSVMRHASLSMPQRPSFFMKNVELMFVTDAHSDVRPPKIPFTLDYCHSASRIEWLIPNDLNSITLNNELGKKLMPIIDLASQWSTTIKLFELFSQQIPSMSLVLHMLPWIKLAIPKLDIMNYKYNSTNRGVLQDTIKDFLNKCLKSSEPRYVPGVSKWFGQVCSYGTELVSLHSMSKIESFKRANDKSYIIPVIGDPYVKDGLVEHFNEFFENRNPPLTEKQKMEKPIDYPY